MKILALFLILFIVIQPKTTAQEPSFRSTIRGLVIDQSTEEPLPYVNIVVVDSEPLIGGITNEAGEFILTNIPVGRTTIQVSYLGYETTQVTDLVVSSAKEIVLTVRLAPKLFEMDELVVRPTVIKNEALNPFTTVSSRMLSVEEAQRYAGGFDDPARLASSFPGVANEGSGSNAIVIRGNAPKFLQWKIEGVEIPNPNHFANLEAFGGGGLTALSSNLLSNSDFLTGAFPAEYNNALAGVFDMRIRNGNSNRFEHSVETGLIGIDFTSEGSIVKGNDYSYIANYRYSTLSLMAPLLPEDANGTTYQDLSFKVALPTQKFGLFSWWGIGLVDESRTNAENDTTLHVYYQDQQDQNVEQYMFATGLSHKVFIHKTTYLQSMFALTGEGLDLKTDQLSTNLRLVPENKVASNLINANAKVLLNMGLKPTLLHRTGVNVQRLAYRIRIQENRNSNVLQTLSDETGSTYLLAAFSQFNLQTKRFSSNVGITTQYFTLNKSFTVEPRFGILFPFTQTQTVRFGYGLHSRIEPLPFYFIQDEKGQYPNKNLSLTKAHHLVIGYDWKLNEHLVLKIEPYFQYLFDVPVRPETQESLLNLEGDWFLSGDYVTEGKGRNWGIDFSLEQFMNNHLYFLMTGSIFQSRFTANDHTWYNTRFNRVFIFTMLGGKEFLLGAHNTQTLSLNVRFTFQGGPRYSKVDQVATQMEHEVVFDTQNPFSEQISPSFIGHLTMSYQWNFKNTTHRWALKILNANGYESFLGHRYNLQTQEAEIVREALIIPNISYRYSF